MKTIKETLTYGTFTLAGVRHIGVTANSYGPFSTAEALCDRTIEGQLHEVEPGTDGASCAECLDLHARRTRPHPGDWVCVVTEPVRVEDGSRYATACNYEVKVLQPGEYPMRWTTIEYGEVPAGARPYYGVVSIPAVTTETYETARLFTAARHSTERDLAEPSTYGITRYEYEFHGADTLPVLGDGAVYLKKIG